MSFFQNPFSSDFYGVMVLSDRQYSIDFKCPRNAGRGDDLVNAWTQGPYNLSGNDGNGNPLNVFTISFANHDPKAFVDLNITISGANMSAVQPSEFVTSLQANTTFNDQFTASLSSFTRNGPPNRVLIRTAKTTADFFFYVQNIGAETALNFNRRAGIAQLPSYFARHTILNRYAYPDSQGLLVLLNTAAVVDQNLIDNAVDAKGNSLGFSHTSVSKDYTLIAGRSGLFMFNKNTVDGSGRITQSIIYPAGAQAGDLAKLVAYTYTSTNTNPTTVTEVPYVLASGDLLTP